MDSGPDSRARPVARSATRSGARLSSLLMALVLVAAACSGADDSDEATPDEAPADGTAPDADTATGDGADDEDGDGADGADGGAGGDGARPGDLLEVAAAEVRGVDAWTVRYLSTGVGGDLVEVTGTVLAPDDGAPGAEVVAWTHGTTGVADRCAPSVDPRFMSAAAIALAQAGHVVAVTDYEGLGTDGVHPYLVGESEGRSAIDIVRAVGAMDLDTGFATTGRYAVAGLSQGGHAALWAGQVAPHYAPELDLVGVVAAAPAADLGNLMRTVGTPAQGFAMMAAVAYDATYDDVALADYFSPEAIEATAVVETGCNIEVFAAFVDLDREAMINPAGWDGRLPVGPLAQRLAENEAAQADVEAPVLFIQGSADAIVDRTSVEALHQAYCAGTTNAEYRLYPGGGHGDTIATAGDEVEGWLADRFAGAAVADGCAIVDPDLAAIQAAEATQPAVAGTLFGGANGASGGEGVGVAPAGYDLLVSESTAPPVETCPGTPAFGGRTPVAFSSAMWGVEELVGPFVDGFVARFASAREAAAALTAYDAELVDCGSFIDPVTTAEGSYTRLDPPGLGDDSYHHEFSGSLSGIPVFRVTLLARVGDTVYGASESRPFAQADADLARQALESILP